MLSTTRRCFLKSIAILSAAGIAPDVLHRGANAAPADGWIELFDGKSLAGWHKNPMKIGHGTGGNWQVEDGSITGEQDPPGSGNGGILLTERKFGDFELLIDLKPDWGICSGLFLRGNERGQCHERGGRREDQGSPVHGASL